MHFRLAVQALVPVLVATLGVVLATSSSSAGSGASITYVDGTGDCASLTPCFTTIQQAVRLVEADDTEIRVFPGTYNESVDLDQAAADTGGIYGDLGIISVDATGAEAAGALVNGDSSSPFFTTESFDADLLIDGFTVLSSADDGIAVTADGGITIRDVTANGAAGDGVSAESTAGDILVESSYASRSVPEVGSPDGFDLFTANGDITVTGVHATGQEGPDGSHGIQIESNAGNVLVHNSIANFNEAEGISIFAHGDVTVTAAGAEGNAWGGLFVDTTQTVLVEFFGTRGNSDNGMDITSMGDVTIRDSFARDNADAGVQIATTEDVVIERVSAVGNMTSQALVSPQGRTFGGIEIVSHPEAGGPSANSLLIAGSLVSNNNAEGILLLGVQDDAPVTITSNAICQNAGAGVSALMNAVFTLTNNWWGETTGPTHPDNPEGGGDEILYLQGGGTFDPWITTVEGEVVSPPVREGQPAEIAFTFDNKDGTGGMEQGLGWPAEIEVATDNGVLASEVPGQEPGPSVAGEILDGVLSVELTADTPGNAIIDVTAPCGLGGELLVPVEAVRIWGDNNCADGPNPVDGLLALRFDAGLSTNTGDCPEMGDEVDVTGASLHPWGDVDCNGAVDPVDGLKLLRYDAGLEVAQEPECPEVGAEVLIAS